jgi:hypothetical protein
MYQLSKVESNNDYVNLFDTPSYEKNFVQPFDYVSTELAVQKDNMLF